MVAIEITIAITKNIVGPIIALVGNIGDANIDQYVPSPAKRYTSVSRFFLISDILAKATKIMHTTNRAIIYFENRLLILANLAINLILRLSGSENPLILTEFPGAVIIITNPTRLEIPIMTKIPTPLLL